MKSKYFIFCILMLFIQVCTAANAAITNTKVSIDKYLTKPTGQYGVGFEDFHWINQNACPDLFFNGKNQDDFSATNKNHCHEILARVYYPTRTQVKKTSSYQPIKSQEQEILTKVSNIPKEQIEQFSQIKSFSIKKSEIVKRKKFPVLLFSPGLGYPSQIYENIITELVSHGYIIIGINTPFISVAELPNGHTVKVEEIKSPISKEKEHKFVDLPAQDLMYVFNKIHTLNTNLLFSEMDLNHIGLLGHSIGGRATEDTAQSHPYFFQALATLDGDAQASQKKFSIPFMDMKSAKIMLNEKNESNSRPELKNNSYLVVLSPDEQNSEYSYHMNFSDLSTLQYLPIYQTYKTYLKQHQQSVNKKFYLKLISHEPTMAEQINLIKPTFVLIKKDDQWNIFIYEDKVKKGAINISKIQGLIAALDSLPNKPVEELLDSEILSVKKILLPIFNHPPAGFLGTGDGWEIASSVNSYLLQFFDIYLKGKGNSAFNNCTALTKNTYIKCD